MQRSQPLSLTIASKGTLTNAIIFHFIPYPGVNETLVSFNLTIQFTPKMIFNLVTWRIHDPERIHYLSESLTLKIESGLSGSKFLIPTSARSENVRKLNTLKITDFFIVLR